MKKKHIKHVWQDKIIFYFIFLKTKNKMKSHILIVLYYFNIDILRNNYINILK